MIADIINSWREGATEATENPVPGFGTHISGDGLDVNTSGNPSMLEFDNQNIAWNPVLGGTTAAAGQAYNLLVRGDRTIDLTNNDTETATTVLRHRGELQVGDFTVTNLGDVGGATDLKFVGNPYHAQVNMQAVLEDASGVDDDVYYIWDPNIGDVGAYVTVDFSTGTNPSGSDANQYLQPNQAAFIQATANNASITFKEEHKKTDGDDLTATFSMQKYVNVKLHTQEDYQPYQLALDGIRVNFGDQYLNTTEDDFRHPLNPNETLSRVIEDNAYSIEYRQNPLDEEVLQLDLRRLRHTHYVFEIHLENMDGTEVFLHDQYLDEVIEIDDNLFAYSFEVDESIAESLNPARFQLIFENDTFSTDEFYTDAISLYPNPSNGTFTIAGENLVGDTEVSIYNQLGQRVYSKSYTHTNKNLQVNDLNMPTGVYLVKVESEGKSYNLKLLIK